MKWTNNIRIVSATPASESTILIDWSDGSRRLFDAAPHMRGDYFDELGDPLLLREASHSLARRNRRVAERARFRPRDAVRRIAPYRLRAQPSPRHRRRRRKCARDARTGGSQGRHHPHRLERRLAQVVRRMGACGQLHRRPLRRILCCAGEDRPRRQRCDLAERRRLQRRRGVRQVGRIEKTETSVL